MKQLKAMISGLLCFCLSLCAFALSESYVEEKDGSKWYENGRIEWADGTVTQAVSDDKDNTGTESSTGENGSGSSVVHNEDGSITVITSDEDPNFDGSLDLPPEPTRAPLEGDEWKAALEGVAAANGDSTPTVWTDPATGEAYLVEDVVYMGIGRSMVVLNGKKQFVNTVDLKWETEAPEDKVLATVASRYVWMRKKPGNDKKNLKFMQIYRDSVMRVVKTGKNWTMVDYGGYRGYVATGSLEFFCNDHTEIEAGYISYKGKIKGNTPIQVRDLSTMKILESYKIGTPVTVFDVLDDWTEIDVEGWHCVIRNEYVTLEKELASAK